MSQGDVDAPLYAVYLLGCALYNALLSTYMQAFLPMDRSAQAFQALVDIAMVRIAAYYMPHSDVCPGST
jgi:hypothetical protein